MQEPSHVCHDAIEIDVAHFDRLSAAEREELARERRRTLGILRQVGDRIAQVPRHAFVCSHLLGAPEDHGEDVVEVVRHAAGQSADGLQLLGLTKLAARAADGPPAP